jgi:hypothetical protein
MGLVESVGLIEVLRIHGHFSGGSVRTVAEVLLRA